MNEHVERTAVVILTSSYRIEGKISLLPNSRVTDFIQHEGGFIVVTDAGVMDQEGNLLFTSKVINVSREHVEIIAPGDGVAFR